MKILRHCSPASAALTTQSPTSRLPSTPAHVVDYDGGRRKYAKTSRFGSTAHSSDDLARYAGTAALALYFAFYATQSLAGNGLLDCVYGRLECHTC